MQTLYPITTEKLKNKTDEIYIAIGTNLMVKARFDIGDGYDIKDFKILKRLRRMLDNEEDENIEQIKTELSRLQNIYL